jgi:DNA polymerase-3 subunit delta'
MPALSSQFGQSSAIASLRRAIAGNSLPGTYLFVGAPGIGKGALAAVMAQAAACLNPTADPADSCGICESCRRAEAGTQPEIQTILPAGEATQIWQFWERDHRPDSGLLTRTLNYAPVVGRRRVYIIERAETLTESAANSLLKVLEEPPPYVLFILSAPHPARILPTIVSRSQMIRLIPAPKQELANYLRSTFKVDEARASLYAALAEGKTGQAVSLTQTPRVSEEIGRVLDFAETIPEAPPLRALKLAEQIRKLSTQMKALTGDDTASAGDGTTDDGDSGGSVKDKASRRKLAAVFDLLVVFYRDLMALSVGGAVAENIMNRERAQELTRLSRISNTNRWVCCLDSLMIARRRLDANASIAMVTDVLVIALTE